MELRRLDRESVIVIDPDGPHIALVLFNGKTGDIFAKMAAPSVREGEALGDDFHFEEIDEPRDLKTGALGPPYISSRRCRLHFAPFCKQQRGGRSWSNR